MKTKFLLLAAVAGMMAASCVNDDFTGADPALDNNDKLAINFTGGDLKVTRANVTGADAATLLGNSFRVYGTSTKDGVTTPVFDNYVVNYDGNAGGDSTNVKGWTYLGQTSLSVNPATQVVKYWDFDAAKYDFVAFAGLDDATKVTSNASNTFAVNQTNIGKIFISNRVTATRSSSATGTTQNVKYGDPNDPSNGGDRSIVTFNFRRIAARVRLGIYETIPGYAVKDVKFYYDDNYLAQAGTSTKTVAGLRGQFPVSGNVTVTYDENNIAQADFDPTTGVVSNNFQFGELDYTKAQSSLVGGGFMKEDGSVDATGDAKFLSGTSAKPTFAKKDAVLDGQNVTNSAWQSVLPFASNATNLVLRVDFTLVALDGVGAPINVKGASAVVPVEYAMWKPNYAYTYIFKISDKTNGTTGPADPNPQDPDTPNPDPDPSVDPGLYAITFDAAVSSVEDYKQETITGVTPLGGDAITTYSETSDVTNNNEYKVGETIIASSISSGMWRVAYSAAAVTEQGLSENSTFSYTTIAGAPAAGQTVNESGVTSAQFKAEKAGYYIINLRYLPTGRDDAEGNYVNIYKVVKVVE